MIVPNDLIGPYYLFVVTDPARNLVIGNVFEGNDLREINNDRPSDVPVVIENPPASDLEVADIAIPPTARAGEPIHVSWTVHNQSGQAASGSWSDAVYLSTDATWDIGDRPMGRATFAGTLQPDGTYTLSLDTTLPAATPGQYRIIVRADIFNQVFEDEADANNTTASPDALAVSVDELVLGVLRATTLNTGQSRLYQVTVPLGATLKVTLSTSAAGASNELFLRHGAAPTSALYDAAYQGALAATQTAVIPSTEPGVYYILVRGFNEPASDTPITILAELVPLAITDVRTDFGGDGRFVTTTIEGARFHESAIVKLIRPGFAEYEPVAYEVLDSTRIRATFDLTNAPHGLYDLTVINPGGERAIVPYRFQVERAIEPEATIGLGGPRVILAGDTGTYSVAIQNLANLDAPYIVFNVGIPEMGINEFVYNLPYVQFFSNLRGAPPQGGLDDVPWSSLDSAINATGTITASGTVFDLAADGFTGFTFNVTTYPGLKELHDRNFEELRAKLYAMRPDLADQGVLDDGPEGLDLFFPGLYALWSLFGDIPDIFTIPFIPFQFHVVASATALTREQFVARSLADAETLRLSVLADPTASSALSVLAADSSVWGQMYLASLEETGLLRPDGDIPPIREQPLIVSLAATLATGILAGPAGSTERTSGSLADFFAQVKAWYGDRPGTETPYDSDPPIRLIDNIANPVPLLPTYDQYDLGLSSPTAFQTFRVFVPWIGWAERSRLPADFQITGAPFSGGDPFDPLNLAKYLTGTAPNTGLASLVGPFTAETGGFVPRGEPLPYTVYFQNDPASSTHVNEVRVVTALDADLDPRSFRLGDLKIGDISVHIPAGRGLFQGDFDFVATKGFILRVSAGVDLVRNEATWLLQAIDPLTGELLQDPTRGLLPPNNAAGSGAGFVTYTILPLDDAPTGTVIEASAARPVRQCPARGHDAPAPGARRRRARRPP